LGQAASDIASQSLAIIFEMSRVKEEIIASYPSWERSTVFLPVDASDLLLMRELAAHAVDRFDAGDVADVRPAFHLAERFLASPLDAERDAAALGFLETIQNVASHRKYGMSAFEQFLGAKSQVAWAELIEVWRGKASLAEVVATETGATLRPPWWQFWKSRKRSSPKDMLKNVENPELRRIIEQITRE
jgi:hypothetical protein